ncbi:hypothetical protein ACHHYP_06456 [Achlya hypogyna]|uniref:Myb-like domain-containing protein n=1 Tax=Achlya hypogyna TaxID=1202772 RepID=A0A1V9YTT0_ACHHY|nr:hypothetical protein ACHHYP_06456 [Achlya hypogyna]
MHSPQQLVASAKANRWSADQTRRLLAIVNELYPNYTATTKVAWTEVAKRMGDKSATQCSQKVKRSHQPGVQLGHWTAEALARLDELTLHGGPDFDWATIAQSCGRTVKQVTERYYEHSDPSIVKVKNMDWTDYELHLLEVCYGNYGSAWAQLTTEFNCRLSADADSMASLRLMTFAPQPRRSIVDIKAAIKKATYFTPSTAVGRKKRVRTDDNDATARCVRPRLSTVERPVVVESTSTAPTVDRQQAAIAAVCALGVSAAQAKTIIVEAMVAASAPAVVGSVTVSSSEPEPAVNHMLSQAECVETPAGFSIFDTETTESDELHTTIFGARDETVASSAPPLDEWYCEDKPVQTAGAINMDAMNIGVNDPTSDGPIDMLTIQAQCDFLDECGLRADGVVEAAPSEVWPVTSNTADAPTIHATAMNDHRVFAMGNIAAPLYWPVSLEEVSV